MLSRWSWSGFGVSTKLNWWPGPTRSNRNVSEHTQTTFIEVLRGGQVQEMRKNFRTDRSRDRAETGWGSGAAAPRGRSRRRPARQERHRAEMAPRPQAGPLVIVHADADRAGNENEERIPGRALLDE